MVAIFEAITTTEEAGPSYRRSWSRKISGAPSERCSSTPRLRSTSCLRQNPLEKHPRDRIPIAEVAHHLTVGLDRDALGDQIFFDHVDQVLALDALRGGA